MKTKYIRHMRFASAIGAVAMAVLFASMTVGGPENAQAGSNTVTFYVY